jgi:hypothetical protein
MTGEWEVGNGFGRDGFADFPVPTPHCRFLI